MEALKTRCDQDESAERYFLRVRLAANSISRFRQGEVGSIRLDDDADFRTSGAATWGVQAVFAL